ncbi:MAG: TIGR00282 family metallophosphoesterase [Candidatus Rifleibacteriota bacterium]
MFAIAFMGVIMHELPMQQVQAMVATVKKDVEENCFVVCNANGLFSAASGLAKQIEMLFESGIELVFLGEQAIARNAGRAFLCESTLPVLRPMNLGPGSPGVGAKLIEIGNDKIWFVSLTDLSPKAPVGLAHERLENFLGNKQDDFPVLISVNGNDPDYKKSLFWRYSNFDFSIGIVGTGMNFRCGIPRIDGKGNLFLADVGTVCTADSIAGIKPEVWWQKNIEKVPVPAVHGSAPLEVDCVRIFYENGKVVKVSQKNFVL